VYAEKAIPMNEHVTRRKRVTPARRGSYGIDAPYAPAFMAMMAALEVILAIVTKSARLLLAALFILAILGLYLHDTLRGKFVVWAELLDGLNLRGDERILDMGCGRGAVLLMAAQHLTGGGRGPVAAGRPVREFP
jgi:arsenite methyltransferase